MAKNALQVSNRAILIAVVLLGTVAILLSPTIWIQGISNLLMVNLIKKDLTKPGYLTVGKGSVMSFLNEKKPWVQARYYKSNQELFESKIYYELAINEIPENPVIRHQYGMLLFETDQFEKAVEHWTIASSEQYLINLGLEYIRTGQIDETEKFIQLANLVTPSEPEVQFGLAEFFFSVQDWDKAIVSYDNAIRNQHQQPTWLFTAYLKIGGARLAANKDLGAAELDFQKAIDLRPGDPWPYIRLCELYRNTGNLDIALDNCLAAISITPKLASGYYYLGRIYFEQMDYEAAIRSFQEAVELRHDFLAAIEWLDRSRIRQSS